MPEQHAVYVFDTVVLSNFALAGRLDLLVSRYGQRAKVTREVLDEVIDGIVAGYPALGSIEAALDQGELGVVESLATETERRTYRHLLRVLAPGEAACIAFAEAHGAVVVTDDKTARACCMERGIPFTGTIGILIACCRDQTLSIEQADQVLQAMIDAGYYAPVQHISALGPPPASSR